MLRVIAVSDTHCQGRKVVVPNGDLLIHAGDLTYDGSVKQVYNELKWLDELPHLHKVVVPGNHDWLFEETEASVLKDFLKRFPTITFLIDQSVEIEGYKIFGSPWQPFFFSWAYNFPQDDDGSVAKAKWAEIPDDTDILITHGPPYGIMDWAPSAEHAGCPRLGDRITYGLPSLKLHVYGHLHREIEDTKIEIHGSTTFINASTCNDAYKPVNPPVVIDLPTKP